MNNDMVEFILGDLLKVPSSLFDIVGDNTGEVVHSLDLFLDELLPFDDFLLLFLIAARAHNSNASARHPAAEVLDECSSGNFALVST